MSWLDFYNQSKAAHVAVNLFHGWGYNFYRRENQLRADDLLVRGKVCEFLSEARQAVSEAESKYRREHLPLSLDPLPGDQDHLTRARRLEAIVQRLTMLIGRINSNPAPETDRILQRHRQERQTLERLISFDEELVGQSYTLREAMTGKAPEWVLDHEQALREGFEQIESVLRRRRDWLL